MLKILFLGNDERSKKTSEILCSTNKIINATILQNEEQLKEIYDVYIFPIPMSLDGDNLNNKSININLTNAICNIPKNVLIITGGKSIRDSIDVALRDDFAYKNAIPTAEGAIALAMKSTPITLYDSNILVTGFGKVSKILVERLQGLCKNVTVTLRNQSDAALLNTLGIKTIPIEMIAENLYDYNIIFNTIPYKIFTKEILSKATQNNLFIELASNILGFDSQAIKDLNINFINAPGLPNKVAPLTAAYIFADTIINILNERNLI